MDDELLKLFGIDPKKLVAKADTTRVRPQGFRAPKPTRTIRPTPKGPKEAPSRPLWQFAQFANKTVGDIARSALQPTIDDTGLLGAAKASIEDKSLKPLLVGLGITALTHGNGKAKSLQGFLNHLEENNVISAAERAGVMEKRHALWMGGERDVDKLNAPVNALLQKKGQTFNAPRMFADSVVARAGKSATAPSEKTAISLTPDRSPLPIAGNSEVTAQQRAFEENLARGKTALPDSVAARGVPEVLALTGKLRKNSDLPRVRAAVDTASARMMARTYESLPKNDPQARAAYDALNAEVDAQHKALTDAGYKFEYVNEDPYKNSAEMIADMRDNKRLKVLKTPRPRIVFHGTTAPGFDVPTRSSDLGPHVGTAGQADEILRGAPFDAPRVTDTWRPEGARMFKLLDYTQNPLVLKKDAAWGDPKEWVKTHLVDSGLISSDDAAGLTDFPKIKSWLQSKGFDSVEYRNTVEADRWTGRVRPRRMFANSRVIFDPEKHLRNAFEPEQAFHPYMTPEQNDKFRAVHDALAHAGEGHQFGPVGEENAYRVHASTLSPLAQRALATETRGQNSWVNFGPNAHLPVKERPFAEQKAALWPEHLLGDYDKMGQAAGDSVAAHGAESLYRAATKHVDAKEPFIAPIHSLAHEDIRRAGLPLQRDLIQDGFITSDGRFVTRGDAARIAGKPAYEVRAEDVNLPGTAPINVPQKDLPRMVAPRMTPERANDVEEEAYKTFTSDFWKDLAREGNFGHFYHTMGTEQKALDALGDNGAPSFRRLAELTAASTARSNPANNLRRGTWLYGLERAGLLDPDLLRSGAYKRAPEGMGHLAQGAHHDAVANLLEEGWLNSLLNPKPASFGANLARNWRPYTNDTRMMTGAVMTNPRLFDLGAARMNIDKQGGAVRYSPRLSMYAPLERAAQRASEYAASRGIIEPPAGYDPTAFWQAKVWDALGEHIPGASRTNGSFDDIFAQKLSENAKQWGVSPSRANQLLWQGNPFDLSLNANILPKGLLSRF